MTSALIAAPVFLYLTWLGGWVFIVTLLTVSVVIQLEIVRMIANKGVEVQMPMVLILGIPVLLISVLPDVAWILFLTLLLITLIIETFSTSGYGWRRLMVTLMVALLIPILLSGLLVLRSIGTTETGFAITATFLFMVWANDIFAFIGGRTLGKHPLAPSISPNKTVEGFFSGFGGSFFALYLSMTFLPDLHFDWKIAIPFAVLIGLFGPVGDLAESKLKRVAGIKDSSGLMPGHGGLFDRFDAMLFAAPAAAVYFQILQLFSAF